jgi:hypothetical protein
MKTFTGPSHTDQNELAQAISGNVWLPADAGYGPSVATWDESVAKRPKAVVVAGSVNDIGTAARWAGKREAPIAITNTGHGALADDRDTVLISVARLRGVQIDPARRLCRVEPGARWEDVNRVATPYRLSGLAGGSPQVGVVGYTVGGGLSPIGRSFGFATDKVTSIDVLDAQNRPLTVTRKSEPELFWALCGGGNIAPITALEFELIELPTLFGGGIFYEGAAAADVLNKYREWIDGLDRRTSTSIALLRLPAAPQLPETLRGRYVVHLRIAHVDPQSPDIGAAGRRIVAPMLTESVILNATTVMGPDDLPSIHRDPVAPMSVTYQGALLDALSETTIECAAAAMTRESELRMIEFRHLGGAFDDESGETNSATGRHAAFNLFTTMSTGPYPAANRALVDAVTNGLSRRSDRAQLNFCGPTPDFNEVLRLWSPEDAVRLRSARRRIDPSGRLHTGRPIG